MTCVLDPPSFVKSDVHQRDYYQPLLAESSNYCHSISHRDKQFKCQCVCTKNGLNVRYFKAAAKGVELSHHGETPTSLLKNSRRIQNETYYPKPCYPRAKKTHQKQKQRLDGYHSDIDQRTSTGNFFLLDRILISLKAPKPRNTFSVKFGVHCPQLPLFF